MTWRLLSFLVFQLLGGLLAWYLATLMNWSLGLWPDVLLGVVLGGLVWFLLDTSRSARLLVWLRAGEFSDTVMTSGLWGEISDRIRRVVRVREAATRDSQSRLQDFLSAFQASPNGVVLLAPDARIEWFNQTAAAHFGLDAERDMLQHFGNLVREPSFANYFAAKDYRVDVLMPGRNNTATRPVRLSVQLFPYGEGRLLMLSRDVTALEQAEAQRRDFVANVSHEIRTPLTVLGGFVETLQTLSLQENEREHYLSLMAEQAQRMQTLVSDLLLLSRLEGSPPPGSSQSLSMHSAMRQLEQDGRALSAVLNPAAERAHKLVFGSFVDGEIVGAASELLSAMSNLVSNAIRYTPVGGEIHVRSLLLSDGKLEFSVTDTGPGIAPEHIGRLTERFYRVDRSRSRDTGGTGLGLAIVKHVAQRHNAELKIESELGAGSRFSLLFPANRVKT